MLNAMATVRRWTGLETKALREALRLSVRDFAAHLGVGTRTVGKWEARQSEITLRPELQAVLDTALAQASEEEKARFSLSMQVREEQRGEASAADARKSAAPEVASTIATVTALPVPDEFAGLLSASLGVLTSARMSRVPWNFGGGPVIVRLRWWWWCHSARSGGRFR
jgi:transcriptional regulator with XRE-family HTH domain